MNNWHKYDAIAPTIRGLVTRIKYGNAQPSQLVMLLRFEADKIEREQRALTNQVNQETLPL